MYDVDFEGVLNIIITLIVMSIFPAIFHIFIEDEAMCIMIGAPVGIMVGIFTVGLVSDYFSGQDYYERVYEGYKRTAINYKHARMTLKELSKYYSAVPDSFELHNKYILYKTKDGEVFYILLNRRDFIKYSRMFFNTRKFEKYFPDNKKHTAQYLKCVQKDVEKTKEAAKEYLKMSKNIMDDQIRMLKESNDGTNDDNISDSIGDTCNNCVTSDQNR